MLDLAKSAKIEIWESRTSIYRLQGSTRLGAYYALCFWLSAKCCFLSDMMLSIRLWNWCSRNFGFHTWHFSDGLCVRGRGSISSSTKWEVRTKESWQKSASIFMKQYLTYISWKMVWGKRIQEEGENTQLGGVWKGPNAMSYQPALHSSILAPFLGSLF